MKGFAMYRRTLSVLATAVLLGGALSAPPAAGSPPSWHRYVVAPASRDVRPVRVLSTAGDVTNPLGALGQGVATLKRDAPPPKPAWPAGTSATASSFHAPNTGNDGQPRTYVPGNAIDGNTDTFWNDDTIGAYPDVLTITAPSNVSLPGITLLSNVDGVPQDFTVDAWDGTTWQPVASITGNADVQRQVPFASTVSTTQVRITVTKDQSSGKGDFTRVNEVWPG
ncbi:MAG TPA: discoidin domain-containing protein, partial [Jatrophihabitantaceae bacterium]